MIDYTRPISRIFRLLGLSTLLVFGLAVLAGDANKDDELTLRSVYLESRGITLSYAEQGRGNANLLILIHGYLDSWFSFSGVMENLSPNYHVIAITMRGHGDSDKPLTGYEMTDLADDVVAFMDHFHYNKASFLGHSMGSVICQRIAIDHPNLVKKLMLMGSTAKAAGNEVLLYVADVVAPLDDPIPHDFVYEFQAGTAPSPISQEFIDGIVTETEKVPARVWRDALAGLLNVDHSSEISQIKAHTLIIWGGEDGIFSRAEQDYLLENIPGAERIIYPNLSHSPNWQQPRLVAFEIENFLRSQRPNCPNELVP